MKGYVQNIEKLTVENDNYRKVLYTGKHMQLVLMTLQPGEEIGLEQHEGHDQFFRIEEGQGRATIDDNTYDIQDDDAIIVPAGAWHNVINTGTSQLRLYTLYAPPEHREGVLHPTKADDREEHFDGTTTE
ncbi:MAG TPA: cupin domain-containing protein [Porticoccaceae bacterium]